MQFRHEWKHEISRLDLMSIRQVLRAVAETDPHAVDGRYFIRSLYFDNIADKALREKVDGVNMREKFRIRLYDNDPSVIHLEKKIKVNGLCGKKSAAITADEASRIQALDTDWMAKDERMLVRELYAKMQSQLLRPRTIVDYTREPYIYAPGNVRVTFDYDIRTGLYGTDLLDPDAVTIPAGDAPIILEVKWDDFLPEIIRLAVQVKDSHTQSFSKYAQCRIYG